MSCIDIGVFSWGSSVPFQPSASSSKNRVPPSPRVCLLFTNILEIFLRHTAAHRISGQKCVACISSSLFRANVALATGGVQPQDAMDLAESIVNLGSVRLAGIPVLKIRFVWSFGGWFVASSYQEKPLRRGTLAWS